MESRESCRTDAICDASARTYGPELGKGQPHAPRSWVVMQSSQVNSKISCRSYVYYGIFHTDETHASLPPQMLLAPKVTRKIGERCVTRTISCQYSHTESISLRNTPIAAHVIQTAHLLINESTALSVDFPTPSPKYTENDDCSRSK